MAEEEVDEENEDIDGDGEEGEDGEGEEGGGGFNAKKIIMFVVLPILLLGGGGAAAYFTGLLDPYIKEELQCEGVTVEDETYDACIEAGLISIEPAENSVFFEIPDLVVNLNSTSRQPRFLKIAVKLELPDEESLTKIEAVMPRVIDHFQTYLRELRVEDLRGSSGIYRLRLELLSRVNTAAPNVKVRDVLFQEILIQ